MVERLTVRAQLASCYTVSHIFPRENNAEARLFVNFMEVLTFQNKGFELTCSVEVVIR